MGTDAADFWDNQQTEEGFDSFLDSPDLFDEEDEQSKNTKEDEAPRFQLDLKTLCTKYLKIRGGGDIDEDNSAIIETSLYQYMIDNYEKVMYWLTKLSNSLTCQQKFSNLDSNTYMEKEDLIQETYARVLKTFYDNEQRLNVCSNCTHQCSEFLNQTKRTNTEKFTKKYGCRPYMRYRYTEKLLHNYMNRSLKQNIDIKLKKITNSDGKRVLLRTSESIGNGEDACELGTLLSDALSSNEEELRDLIKLFLSKKIIFTSKIANFELEPDLWSEYKEKEIVNDEYDEWKEENKKERRKIYRKYGIPIPQELEAIPKVTNSAEEQLLKDKFDLICPDYEPEPNCALEDVLPDDVLMDYLVSQGNDPEEVDNAYMESNIEFLENLPSYKEISEWKKEDPETYNLYGNYLKGWDYEDIMHMTYDPKKTEIKIVDPDYQVVPLPLCAYAEITISDFLNLCLDLKEGQNFMDQIFSHSSKVISFKEFWIDWENMEYNVAENFEFQLPKNQRNKLFKLEKFARRMLGKNIDPEVSEVVRSFTENTESILDKFKPAFIKRVKQVVEEEIEKTEFKKYISTKKIVMKVPRRKRWTYAEKKAKAEAEVSRILSDRKRLLDIKTVDVNASEQDTSLLNLSSQEELFKSILNDLPTQETVYKAEEVKILCTSQSDNLKNVLSA